jgi:2',3'-cyclic-nucleotide 2'-phosphodiesterase (5'-nucleotidase family)
MKKILYFSAILTFLLATYSCSDKKTDPSGVEIAILHTNDMHASINNMGKLAAYKQEIKNEYDKVFLVSAGDIFSGNPVVDVYKKKGYPMVDLMNKAGYKLTALGNHEFDYGQEILAKRMKQADFQFLCANIDTKNTKIPQPKPYAVLKTKDKKLYFLSLIEVWNEGLPSTHPAKLKNIKFQDPLEIVDKYTRNADEYDAFIGLTHLGYKADQELAKKHPEFDLIIGGHSHTFLDSARKVNNTLITQVGDDLTFVGKTVLSFNSGELTDIHTEVINLDKYEKEDKKIASLIKKYNNNEALNKVIGKAVSPIQGNEELGALFTDAQVEMHNLDFSFQNNGGIRIREIPKGDIRVKTIYELDPFGNDLIKFEMTPKEIKSLLRYSYQKRGEPGLQIGGGSYTLYVDNNQKLKQIVIKTEEGETLHPDSTYTVGLNSYISDSYKFEHKDQGESMYVTTAENIINYIQQKGTIDYAGIDRITVKQN